MKTASNVTILVVDDDRVDVMAVRRAFRLSGLDNAMVFAADGIEALEKLRDGKSVPRPFLVLLDLNMPRMNGIEFLDAARKDPNLCDSVVFVLTTSKDMMDKRKAYSRNVAGYIVKEDTREGYINTAGLLESYARVVELP